MKIIKVKDSIKGSEKSFDIIKDFLGNNMSVIGLATGSTQLQLYKRIIESDLDFSNTISINLDEYIGLAKENKQSYHYYMNENLFQYKKFKKSYIPNGDNKEELELERYNNIINDNKIDLQLLGLGENGHIGFNEPGTSFKSKTNKVKLTKSTLDANKRFFDENEIMPKYAYSMGIGSILSAKTILIIAYGINKADAVKKMIEGPIDESVPASSLQTHKDVIIIIDEAAASKLN